MAAVQIPTIDELKKRIAALDAQTQQAVNDFPALLQRKAQALAQEARAEFVREKAAIAKEYLLKQQAIEKAYQERKNLANVQISAIEVQAGRRK